MDGAQSCRPPAVQEGQLLLLAAVTTVRVTVDSVVTDRWQAAGAGTRTHSCRGPADVEQGGKSLRRTRHV